MATFAFLAFWHAMIGKWLRPKAENGPDNRSPVNNMVVNSSFGWYVRK